MTLTRRLALGLIVLLLLAVGAGLFVTRERKAEQADAAGGAPAAPARADGGAAGAQPAATPGQTGPRRLWLVDVRPLLTARKLAAYASTPDEVELSRHAERLADHAIDLAFVVAMRDAAENAPAQTPELKALTEARAKAQATLDAAQRRVDELQRRLAGASGGEREEVNDQLEVSSAELELDKDELQAASEALARVGGDPQAHIKRLREVYDAAQKEPRPAVLTPPEAGPLASLLERFRAWSWQRDKQAQLTTARNDARDRLARSTKRKADLTARLQAAEAAKEGAKEAAARVTSGDGESQDKQRALETMTRLAADQRRLSALTRRVQDQQELVEVYGAWVTIAEGGARAALHRVLWGFLGLVLLLAAGFVASLALDRLFDRMKRDAARVQTLRTVGRLGLQVLVLLLAVVVVLGVPGQVSTIVGLAGAGLTVAMKDFIVAFFGWFVLMGRNGIRVGDWVEIKGVGGEVVEIGLFHTVLLETGSWNDAGHPTGRRVSFVNSFAIEGHYFNFSTSGQWMWDELHVLIPFGRDPYPVIDGVQKLVKSETAANAAAAEAEWKASTSRYKVQTFSAVPGLHVVPTGSGIEVIVRYITRANERHASRTRLYSSVLELMHGKRGAAEVA